MSKFQRAVDGVIAIFLLALIFFFGYKTIAPNTKKLYDSARLLKKLQEYMPEDYDALDLFAARIRSFEDTFGKVLYKSDELGYLNASLQYALGKDMINIGGYNMLTLPTGDLYEMQHYIDTTGPVDDIIRFAGEIDQPFLYLYEHPTTYGEVALTDGYAIIDKGDEMDDEIIARLRGAGVETLDSRELLAGYPASEIVLRTDHHWTFYASLVIARDLAGRMGLDEAKLDPDMFFSETYPDVFIGKYGERIGKMNVEPDDITVYWPKYDTHISRYTLFNGEVTEIEGPFRDSVMRLDYVDVEDWSREANKVYGLTEDFDHFHNPNAPDYTILIYRDSYSAPVACFLSLVARDVYAVDMRKTEEDATHFVDLYNPDMVVMAYSRQMVSSTFYELYKNK